MSRSLFASVLFLIMVVAPAIAQPAGVIVNSESQGDIRDVEDVTQSEAEALFAASEAAIWFPELRRVRLFVPREPAPRLLDDTIGAFTASLDRDFPRFRSNVHGTYVMKLPMRAEALPPDAQSAQPRSDATVLTDSFENGLSQWQLANNNSGEYNFTTMGCKARTGVWSADATRGGSKGQHLTCWDSYPGGVTTQITHATCDAIQGASQAWVDFYLSADMDDSEALGVYYVASDGYIYGYGFLGTWSGWFHVAVNLRQWNRIGDLTAVPCAKLIFQYRADNTANTGTGAWLEDVTIRTDAPPFLHASVTATPASGAAPLAVSFTPTVGGSAGSEAFEWRFGDSASSSSTSRTPTFTYATPGEYWARLRVSDSTGARAYAHARIQVTSGSSCTVSCSASAPSTAQTGKLVAFTASATPSGCSGSTSYLWNFGDGTTSTQQSPTRAYAAAGTYNWTMTASAGGTTCVRSGTIVITKAAAVTAKRRSISVPKPGSGGTEVMVQPSASPQTFTAGDVSVTVPGGLLTTAKALRITKLTSAPPPSSAARRLGAAYEVTLGDLKTFSKPLIIRLKYDASQVRSDLALERALAVAYYDAQRSAWVEVPATVDRSRNELIVGTNHLTTWGWFMWGAGYPVIENAQFTVSWDPAEMNDPIRGPVYSPSDRSNHVDSKIPDYVEDAVVYLGIAFHRYKAAGFKVPPTPINVYIGGSDPSQRAKFFGHGLTINLNSMNQAQLKMDTAHELFHSFEGSYLTAVGMGTGELPVIGWAPPILSWSVWYVEAAAEYAAEWVAWDGTLKLMGSKLRRDYLAFPLSDVSANHDYGYTTAHFLKFLVDRGASFKAMSEYLFQYDWLNANDYYYPLHEYLERTLGAGKGLPRQYQDFARKFVFDPASPMPAVTDTIHSEVAAYRSTLNDGSETVTVSLPGGYTAKVWGVWFSDTNFSTGKEKLAYTAAVSGTLPAKVEVDVYLLKGDKRVAGGGAPVGTLTQSTKSVALEIEKGDAVYLLAVSSDSTAQQVKLVISPASRVSAYSVKVTQVTSCGDGNARDWGTWNIFEGLQWSGNNFSYTEQRSETENGVKRTGSDNITGTLSADRRTIVSMTIESHGREDYSAGLNCPSACVYEVWKSVSLSNIPAAADWSAALLHYEAKGASARPKITKFVNRVVSSGFSRGNFDCTYPIDETKLDMIEVTVLLH